MSMKRSDLYIRIITAVLFIAVVCYIGVYIYNATLNTFETTTAISYTVEQTYPAMGYIVRSETVLTDAGLVVLPIIGEGEKVASGQAIAVEYMSSAALETASEIRSLRLMIAQLEASGGTASAEAARLKSVMELSRAVQRGDLSRLDELTLDVETGIFAENSAAADDLPAMKARLDALQSREDGIRLVYAPASGTFSQVVDGFEHIRPDALVDILPSELSRLFNIPFNASATCKLVTDFKWYYAAIMDADDASHIPDGRQIIVQFSGAYVASIEMTVEYVSKREDDKRVVLFSSTQSVHELVPLRQLQSDVVSGIVTGIRVPKNAIHLDDDGGTFVFVQTGVRAEQVGVEILSESGDSYLVRDGAETGTPLRAGSTIIVKANNLFDGKVVG